MCMCSSAMNVSLLGDRSRKKKIPKMSALKTINDHNKHLSDLMPFIQLND